MIIKVIGMEISDATELNEKCMQEKYMQQNSVFLQKQQQCTFMNAGIYMNIYVNTQI